MAAIELRPGDTLNIVWKSTQETPLGIKEVESSFAFSYEELLTRLKSKSKAGKSRRSGTNGARFSRIVALSTNALKKGKWSTGADIDRGEVFEKLWSRFQDLDEAEYANITANAKESILALYQNSKYLSPDQKADLKHMVDAIGIN